MGSGWMAWRPILQALTGRLPRMEIPVAATVTTVLILADDLIWASRLKAAVERAGGEPVMVRDQNSLTAKLEGSAAKRAIVDLTSRGYDGNAAITDLSAAGVDVIAVAEHDNLDVRRAALAAGARRVLSYNKMFSDGPQVVGRWLEGEL